MDFPENRYRHLHSVGMRMSNYAHYLGWSEKKCNDMFVLGCIHDIGYALDPDAFKHDKALYKSLQGYKYRKEILYHSYLQLDYDTPEMRLLYFGDMTVDGKGVWTTLDDRLNDIALRYGTNSKVFDESYKIAQQLRKWGFDDTVGLR